MRHKYFRFLACVAMVLACVMMFEVPVSAASYSFEFYDSSTTGNTKTQRFVYYPEEGIHYQIVCKDTSNEYNELSCGVGSSADVHYVPYESKNLFFYLSPLENIWCGGSFNEKFDISLVEDSVTGEYTSFVLDFDIGVYASVKCSFAVTVYCAVNDSSRTNNFNFNFETMVGENVVCPISVDMTQWANELDLRNLFFYVVVSFSRPSIGDSFYVSLLSSSSLPEELDDSIVLTTIEAKAQDTPHFSQNLSSETVSYLTNESSVPLAVSASVSDGGTISYQWYKSSSASGSGNPISGATGKTYTPDTSSESDCYYYCIATSTLDGQTKSAKSNVAHISVVNKPVAPVIYSDLHSGKLEYYQGDTAEPLSFGVYAPDGGTLSYQWYQGDPVYGDPKPISGATSSSYTPPTSVIGTYYYYCVATNSKGPYTQSITSREGRIQIKSPPDPAQPPVITTDLSTEPVTYKEGTAASPLRIIAMSPDGGTLSYQWYEVIDGSAQILAGDTNANFTPDTSVVGEHIYYCVVTNKLLNTKATVTSSRATVIVEEDRTDSLLDTIVGGVSDIIDGILNLPQLIIDGIKSLFIPDAWEMAAYQLKWEELFAARFGAIYEAVVLIDEFGQAIGEQAKQGTVTFPAITLDLAGTPWTFGGWEVKVVPDGFDVVIGTLKTAINIVCTFAFVNGLRHRFEGVIGGA